METNFFCCFFTPRDCFCIKVEKFGINRQVFDEKIRNLYEKLKGIDNNLKFIFIGSNGDDFNCPRLDVSVERKAHSSDEAFNLPV